MGTGVSVLPVLKNGIQGWIRTAAALAEHYQALLHTNDFYQYLTLFKELGQKQTQQQSRGRKINAMDAYFYQMVERVLREELAVTFGESQQEAGRRLLSVLN